MPKSGTEPCLSMGAWVTFCKEDGAELIHLLLFIRLYYEWTPEQVKSKRITDLDDRLPLAQNGKRAVNLRRLMHSHMDFNAMTTDLPHEVHIGFRDGHRDLFHAYLAYIEKTKVSSGEQEVLSWADKLHAFYKDVAARYFPTLLN